MSESSCSAVQRIGRELSGARELGKATVKAGSTLAPSRQNNTSSYFHASHETCHQMIDLIRKWMQKGVFCLFVLSFFDGGACRPSLSLRGRRCSPLSAFGRSGRELNTSMRTSSTLTSMPPDPDVAAGISIGHETTPFQSDIRSP